jgi:urease accessory protein UreF
MNRKSLIALALSTAFAGAALADDITVETTPFVSTATRAEVRADLAAYRQAGVNHASNRYNPLAQFKSQRTRAQVTAEYVASREQVAALTGEDSGSTYLALRRVEHAAQTVAGQPVRAE